MGSDEDPQEYDRLQTMFRHILIFGNVIGILMLILLLMYALIYGGGLGWATSDKAMSLHMFIMVFALIYLQGHASLIYRILPNKPRNSVKLAHAGIHAIVCVAIGIGLAAAVHSKNLTSDPHFFSLHSWLGIITIVGYYLQFLVGFASFLLPIAPTSFRMNVMPIHRWVGQNLLIFAASSTVTGIMFEATGVTNYQLRVAPGVLLNTVGVLVIVFVVIFGSLISDTRFVPRARPEGELLLSKRNEQGD